MGWSEKGDSGTVVSPRLLSSLISPLGATLLVSKRCWKELDCSGVFPCMQFIISKDKV